VSLFEEDLSRLVGAVSRSGAVVVLVTHAFRCQSPPTAEDLDLLNRTRVFSPRPTAMAIHDFHRDINRAIVRLGAARGVGVVDADAVLSGHPQYFGDLIHFNGKGASAMADALAPYLLSALPGRGAASSTLH
jgi:lysophospholipase L1-like esterase